MVQGRDTISAFQAQASYELIATSIPGVFTTPAPPDGFDPLSASTEALLAYGLPVRPAGVNNPTVVRAWERVVSHTKNRIINPKLVPQIGTTHHLRRLKQIGNNDYTSNNWSGSVVRGGNWTVARGHWRVPRVTSSGEPEGTEGGWNSSSWIGLDGAFGSNDVLQIGIQQKVSHNGAVDYVAWYEWFAPPQPNSPPYIYQVNIPDFHFTTGHELYAEVSFINGGGRVYLLNQDELNDVSFDLAPPPGASANGSTAEWIMEAPDGGEPTSSLPRFDQVEFHAASCGYTPDNAAVKWITDGDRFNIVGFNETLTKTTLRLEPDYVGTIEYIGL